MCSNRPILDPAQNHPSFLSARDGSSFDDDEASSAVGSALDMDHGDGKDPETVTGFLSHPFSSMIFIVFSNDAALGSPCLITQLLRFGQYEIAGLSYSFL